VRFPIRWERLLLSLAWDALSSSAAATRQKSRLTPHLISVINMDSNASPSAFGDDTNLTTESEYSDSEGSS